MTRFSILIRRRLGAVCFLAAVALGCGGNGPRSDVFDSQGASPTSAGSSGLDSSSESGDSSTSAASGSTSESSGMNDPGPVKLDLGATPDLGSGAGTLTPEVYAHTNRDLYRIDPDTLAVTHVGPFGFPEGINQMTDLALDGDGRMVGISTRDLYDVDPNTAEATHVADLDRPFNGLTFLPSDSGPDRLVGSTQDGWLYEIDLAQGTSSEIGMHGGELSSSGDLVAVEGLTLATVTQDDWATDRLAELDGSGLASELRELGLPRIYGLGFWGGRVFGFAESGEIIVIDASDGTIEVAAETGFAWWGAGVTTSAPLTPEG